MTITNEQDIQWITTPRAGSDGMTQSSATYRLATKYQRLRLRALGEEYAGRVATFRQLVREIATLNPDASEAAVKSSAMRLVR